MLRQDPSQFVGILPGDQVVVASRIPYNPADVTFGGKYTLTTREGIEYDIDGMTGFFEGVTDRNGNSSRSMRAGVLSSTGKESPVRPRPKQARHRDYRPDGQADRVRV